MMDRLGFRERLVLAVALLTLLSLAGVAGSMQYATTHVSAARGSTLAWAAVIAVGAAFLWSVVVTSWVVDGLTREHGKIAAAVRRFASGDRSARVGLRSRDPEIGRLARDVDAMMEDLERAIDAERRFAANAAHELRSPLTALSGELELALRRPRGAEEYREAIENAFEAATDLRSLAEDLLDLAKAGARAREPEREVDLSAVVDRAACEDGRTTVSVTPGLFVSGRAVELERVVRNLVDNARAHAKERVTVRAEREGDLAKLVVSDDGDGVPEGLRSRIFEPFERAPGSSGTGLGLAICREITTAHAGTIALLGSDVGATFVVTLPLAGSRRDARAS